VLPADDARVWTAALGELGRRGPAGSSWSGGPGGLRTVGAMTDELEALYRELARPGAGA
jgi:hypothetical protein